MQKPMISFEQYLKRRGYVFLSFEHALLRTIKRSFSEKSFCGFWRMWNPFTGYLIFLLYSYLGGNKKRPYAIFLVFLTSGILFHDLVIYLISGSASIVFTITFLLYSLISIIETRVLPRRRAIRRQDLSRNRLQILTRVSLNMMLLLIPLLIGFFINYLVFPQSVMSRMFHFMQT